MIRHILALTLLALLTACASGGGDSALLPRLGEFDVPRPLADVYVSEVRMLRGCKAGPVSNIYDIAIDPRFEVKQNRAVIDIIGTGIGDPHIWATITLDALGAQTTHVRLTAAPRHDGLQNLRTDIERWGNAAGGC